MLFDQVIDSKGNTLCYVSQTMGELDLPYEDVRGPLSNWVSTPDIQRQIKMRFRAFLDQFRDDHNALVYKQRIKDMCIGDSSCQLVAVHLCACLPYICQSMLANMLPCVLARFVQELPTLTKSSHEANHTGCF